MKKIGEQNHENGKRKDLGGGELLRRVGIAAVFHLLHRPPPTKNWKSPTRWTAVRLYRPLIVPEPRAVHEQSRAEAVQSFPVQLNKTKPAQITHVFYCEESRPRQEEEAMKASVPPLLLALTLISLLSLLLLLSHKSNPFPSSKSLLSPNPTLRSAPRLKVFVADLPRSLNYGLLDDYWALSAADSRIGLDPDADLRPPAAAAGRKPYPENPLIKQYSAEYWLLSDLETPEGLRGSSFAERVYELDGADVVFVPFFATLSAEMELGWGRKGGFLKKGEGNGDYWRQKEVVDRIRASEAWRRSGGRDHVFVLTGKLSFPEQFKILIVL